MHRHPTPKAVSILEMTNRIAARWQVLTGHEIDIVRPEDMAVPPAVLNYRCDKLAATGFTLTSQIDREIDDTLKLCLQAFGK
ncbi:MAG: hypothetical protein RI928_2671 [Pseudomonadota bacterium]